MSFSKVARRQEKEDEKEYKRNIKEFIADTKERKKSGYIQTRTEMQDTESRLMSLARQAENIKRVSGNTKGTREAYSLYNKAAKSEYNYRQATDNKMRVGVTDRYSGTSKTADNMSAASSIPKTGPFLGGNDPRANMQRGINAANRAAYDRFTKQQKERSELESLSAKDLKYRIDEIDKRQKQLADRKGYISNSTQRKPNLSNADVANMKNELAKLDKEYEALENEKSKYKTELPNAAARAEESKLSDAEKNTLELYTNLKRSTRNNIDNGLLDTAISVIGNVAGTRLGGAPAADAIKAWQGEKDVKNEEKYQKEFDKMREKGIDVDYLLQYYKTKKDNEEQEQINRFNEKLAGSNVLTGIANSAASVIASPLAGIQGLGEDIRHMVSSDDEKPLPVNQMNRSLANYNQSARKGVSDKIDNKFWNFIYNAGMSTADSAAAIGIGLATGGSGALGSAVTQGLMSVGAADNTYNEAIERGIDPGRAMATGILAGVTEWVTEKYSIDGLKSMALKRPDNIRTLVKNIGKQMATEGSEEAASDVMNTIVDNVVNGKKSEFNQSVKRYKEQGLDSKQAKKAAMMDWLGNTVQDAAAGAVSGFLMGAGGSVAGYRNNQNSMKQYGENIDKIGDKEGVIEYAKRFDDLAESATEVENKAGKKSDKNTGFLADALDTKLSEVIDSAESATQLQDAYNELSENAPQSVQTMIDEKVSSKARELSNGAESGEARLLNRVADMADESYNANMDEIKSKLDDTEDITDEESEKEAPALKAVGADATAESFNESEDSVEGVANETTSENDLRGQKVAPKVFNNTAARLEASGEPVKIDGFENIGTGNAKIKIDGNDAVDLDDLDFDNSSVKSLYKSAVKMDDAAAASAMISNYDPKMDAAKYFREFQAAYNWGSVKRGYDNMINNNIFTLPEHILRQAYMIGENWATENFKKEMKEGRETREGKKSFKKGEGKVIDERRDSKDLEASVFDNIDEKLAKKLSVNIKQVDDLTEDTKDGVKKINGMLDVSNAEMTFSEAAQSAFGVRIHESMEFMEAISPDSYRLLMSRVLNYILDKNSDDSIYDAIMSYREAYRGVEGSKTFAEAADEYINDAISGVFMNEDGAREFIAWLNGEDINEAEKKGLIDTIIEIIDKIVEKLTAIFNNEGTTKAQSHAAKIAADNMKQIRELFFNFADNAINTYKGSSSEGTEAQGKAASAKVSHSVSPDTDLSDDAIKKNIQTIAESAPVTTIDGREIESFGDKKEEQILRFFNSIGNKVYNTELGEILLTKKSVRSMTNHKGKTFLKMASVTALPNVIQKGNVCFVRGDSEGNIERAIVAAPVSITGIEKEGEYLVGATIVISPTTNRLYLHDLIAIKKEGDAVVPSGNPVYSTWGDTESPSTVSILHGILSVKNNNEEEDSKKVEKDSKGRELTPEQQEFFKDSVIRDSNGDLMPLYHQTENEFTVFDTHREGAGAYDSGTPYGVFLKSTQNDIGLRGKKQMELYANITNPLKVSDREHLEYELSKMSPEYESVLAEYKVKDAEWLKKSKEAENNTSKYMTEWVEKNPNRDRRDIYDDKKYQELSDIEDGIIDKWGDEINKLSVKAKEIITKTLKDNGYDGVIIKEDKGSFGRSTDAYIALEPRQVKNIDNDTPTNNPDIRRSAATPTESSDLIRENAQLKEMVEKLQQEFEITGGTKPNPATIKRVANKVLSQYNSSYDVDELVNDITSIYSYLRSENADGEVALKKMSEVAQAILDKGGDVVDNYAELRDYLKKTAITFTDEQKSEIANAFESFGAFRNSLMGKVKISNKGTSLEDAWNSDLRHIAPELFSQDVSAEEMPLILADVIDAIQPRVIAYGNESAEQGAYDLAMQIYTELAKVKPMQTFADKQAAKFYEAMRNVSEGYEKMLEEYRKQIAEDNKEDLQAAAEEFKNEKRRRIAENQSEMKALLEGKKNAKNPKTLADYEKRFKRLEAENARLKKLKDEEVARIRAKYNNRRHADMERRKSTETKNKIRKLHDRFSRMILKPTETMYVPKDLMSAAVAVCNVVNPGYGEGTKLRKALDEARRSFPKVSEEDGILASDFDPRIESEIDELARIFDEKPEGWSIKDASLEELNRIYDAMNGVYECIRMSTKLIREEGEKDARKAGLKWMEELRESKGLNTALGKLADKVSSSFLNSYREFRKICGYNDNGEVMETWKELNHGQRDMFDAQLEASNLLNEAYGDSKAVTKMLSNLDSDLVKVPLKFESGNAPVMVTRGMRLSLIMHGQSQANMRHMMLGGVNIPVNLKTKDKKKRYETMRKVKGINYEAIRQMEMQLTSEERVILDAMKKLFWEWSGEKINETSNKLYGFERARVKNYFPITVNKDYVAADISALKFDKTIEGAGFLKERVTSNNPIILDNILDVAEKTIHSTSLFYGLAIPIRNFNKIINTGSYELSEADGDDASKVLNTTKDKKLYYVPTDSVKQALREKWGMTARNYIDNLIADLQQARSKDFTWYDRLRGNYASAVLTANASVIIKQTSAYPTVAGITGWGPTVKAMLRGGIHNHPLSKADVELINKYTPLYWYRNQGNNSRDFAEIRDMDSAINKIPPVKFAKDLIQKVDIAMVGRFWYAAQYYVDSNYKDLAAGKNGTEEQKDAYYRKVAEVFDRAVEETQSTNMVMQNADIMRNPNGAMKMITMFMGQGLQNFGIVYDNLANMRAKEKQFKEGKCTKEVLSRARKDFANALSSQIVSAAMFAGLAVVARALLHRMNPYRDDKEEVTAESIAKRFSEDMLENIIGSVPFGSLIYETVNGLASNKGAYGVYGQQDVVLESLNDLQKSFQKLGKSIASGEDIPASLNQFLKDGSKVIGIPYENVWNLGEGIFKHVQDVVNGDGFLSFSSDQKDPKAKVIAGYLNEAIINKDKYSQEKYCGLLYELGKSDKQINGFLAQMIQGDEAIVNAANDKVNGKFDSYENAIKEYKEKGYPEAAVSKAIDKIVKDMTGEKEEKEDINPDKIKEISGSYMKSLDSDIKLYKNNDLVSAVESGKYANVLKKLYDEKVKEQTDKGVSKEEAKKKARSGIKTALSREYHGKYLDEGLTTHQRQQIVNKLSKIKVDGTPVYNQKDFERWFKELKKA